MFDYFRNCSSNAHAVCCEDSPNKDLYNRCQSDDHDLHLRSQVRLKCDYCFNLQYFGQYLRYHIQIRHDGIPMDTNINMLLIPRFDQIDLDARSQWVGKINQRWMLSATKRAVNITFATTIGHFVRDLDFAKHIKQVYGFTHLFFCFFPWRACTMGFFSIL